MLKREKFTENDKRKTEKDLLLEQMFDSRIGSKEWLIIKQQSDELDEVEKIMFNPDVRI